MINNINFMMCILLYYYNYNYINIVIYTFLNNCYINIRNTRKKQIVFKLVWFYIKLKTIINKRYSLVSKKIYNTIIPLLLFFFENKDDQNILLCKEGKIVYTTNYMYIKENNNIEYDMILFFWTIEDNNKYDNYVLKFDNIYNVNDKFKTSKISFLAVEICIKRNNIEEIHAIDFKRNNYYITNNILFDTEFVMYWCNNVLKINFDNNYEISFFDNNMNHNIIKNTQYIKILENDFEVMSKN